MAKVVFKRGSNTAITNLPLVDGQILVGYNANNTASMYVDMYVNNTLVRLPISSGSSELPNATLLEVTETQNNS